MHATYQSTSWYSSTGSLTISLLCVFFFGCGLVKVCASGSLSGGRRGSSASTVCASSLSSSGSSKPEECIHGEKQLVLNAMKTREFVCSNTLRSFWPYCGYRILEGYTDQVWCLPPMIKECVCTEVQSVIWDSTMHYTYSKMLDGELT